MVAIKKNIKCTIQPQDLLAAVVWNSAAPPLNIDLDLAARVVEKKRKARLLGIEKVFKDAEKKGKPCEKIVATIIYDSERAPKSTNRKQLAELGVELPKDVASLTAEEVHRFLWQTVNGLALLGIYIVGTNHLSDRNLLGLLLTRIIEEEIRDVPPNPDVSEFIDLTPCKPDSEYDDGIADTDDLAASGRDSLTPRPNRSATAAPTT